MKKQFKVYKEGVTDGMITILSKQGDPFDKDKKIDKYISLGYSVYFMNGVKCN